ncbi:GNAT family N-acetyltransferase [Actinomycetota bacterium]
MSRRSGPRPAVSTVPVTERTIGQLAELWIASRVEQGASAEAARRVADERLLCLLGRPDVKGIIAEKDGAAVGFVILTARPLSVLSDTETVVLDTIFVVPSMRRQGVARALLAATTAWSDQRGADQIISSVPSHLRETNRFFARLGFGSAIVQRATTPASLRRRLKGERDQPALEQLVSRRRNMRARAQRHLAS